MISAQTDLDSRGQVVHPGNFWAQLHSAVSQMQEVLGSFGCVIDDLVKITLYYVPTDGIPLEQILETLAKHLGSKILPTLMYLALPKLAYPGQLVAVDGIAMRGEDDSQLARTASNPPSHWNSLFSHGIRCGEMIYVGAQMPVSRSGLPMAPGDPVKQAYIGLDRIAEVLDGFGAALDDVARINTFYVGHGTAEDWARAGAVRANAFTEPGPCGAGIPVPTLFSEGLTIRQEVIAMLGLDGGRLARRSESPPNHWNWPIKVHVRQGVLVGRKLFVGGQGALDTRGQPILPYDLPRQTHVVMRYIGDVLKLFGASFADVVAMKSYHKAGDEPTTMHSNLSIESQYFAGQGPAMTAVPFPQLAIDEMALETDAFAILDAKS
jgi:enamine deaminase RidA (YjgF/YER057c/UK114 family)